MRIGAGIAILALCVALSPATRAETVQDMPGAVLRGLDKLANATTDLTLKNGETMPYGGLSITLSDCRAPAGDLASNAYAHLRITDDHGAQLFDGWMIASSPALSALDHPRYDVWVLRCTSN